VLRRRELRRARPTASTSGASSRTASASSRTTSSDATATDRSRRPVRGVAGPDRKREPLRTCTIITTTPNETMAPSTTACGHPPALGVGRLARPDLRRHRGARQAPRAGAHRAAHRSPGVHRRQQPAQRRTRPHRRSHPGAAHRLTRRPSTASCQVSSTSVSDRPACAGQHTVDCGRIPAEVPADPLKPSASSGAIVSANLGECFSAERCR
jgi:hypothetical protein